MSTRPRCAVVVCVLVSALMSLVVAGAVQAAPVNDDFGDAVLIRPGQTIRGNINGATRQRGEPPLGDSLARHSVWYRFRAKRKVALGLSTCGASFDSLVAVYVGHSLRSLRNVEFNNDGCGRSGGGSRVTFTARRGRTYRIAVAGYVASGRFRLKVQSVAVPPNDDFADASSIQLGSTVSGTTRNATRELGEPGHTLNGPHTVWFRLRVAQASTVRLYACPFHSSSGGLLPYVAVYTGGRVDRLTRVARTISDCLLQFAAEPGVTYRVVLEDESDGREFRLSARSVTPPANDDFANATPITLETTTSVTTRDASREPGEPGGSLSTVWFRLSVTATTQVNLYTCDPPHPPFRLLVIYTGDQLNQLTQVGRGCLVGFQAQPGVVYKIQALSDPEGDFTLRASVVN